MAIRPRMIRSAAKKLVIGSAQGNHSASLAPGLEVSPPALAVLQDKPGVEVFEQQRHARRKHDDHEQDVEIAAHQRGRAQKRATRRITQSLARPEVLQLAQDAVVVAG